MLQHELRVLCEMRMEDPLRTPMHCSAASRRDLLRWQTSLTRSPAGIRYSVWRGVRGYLSYEGSVRMLALSKRKQVIILLHASRPLPQYSNLSSVASWQMELSIVNCLRTM